MATPVVDTVVEWKKNVAPMGWGDDGRIYYNERNVSKLFRGLSCWPDKTNAIDITSADQPATTHSGISDIYEDYALVVIESLDNVDSNGNPVLPGNPFATPGKGLYNDLWLYHLHSNRRYKLVDLKLTDTDCLIWARFNQTGNKIAWSEHWQSNPFTFGGWRLYVADIDCTTGVLSNKVFIQSSGLMEAYGWTLDNKRIIFGANDFCQAATWNLQVLTLPETLLGNYKRISPWDWLDFIGIFTNYNEFGYELEAFPGKVMYGHGVPYNSCIEFFTANLDSSGSKQLTYFGKKGNYQYQGYPTLILGGLGFNPENPKEFIVGAGTNVADDYVSFKVTLK